MKLIAIFYELATSEVISDKISSWKLQNKYLIAALVSKVN